MIPQPPLKVVSLEDTMVSLADEGVPVCAIARATHTPSEEIYELLEYAIEDGRLVELPRSDWPPGSLRRSRKQPGQSTLNLDDSTLGLALAAVFKMTRLQVSVFLALLRRPQISKDQVHAAIENTRSLAPEETDPKMIDVVIHHIRKKLRPFNIELKTIWGQGYTIAAAEREKVLDLLNAYLQPQQQDAA
jgi:hypothetical protein